MLRLLTRRAASPIGLDVGHDGVRAIQLERREGRWSVLAFARASLPGLRSTRPEDRARAAAGPIRDLLRRGGFRGRRAVAAVPAECLHLRTLRVPEVLPDGADGAVGAEVRAALPFDAAEGVVRVVSAGAVGREGASLREVIVLAARRAEVDAYVEALSESGLRLDVLDAGPTALYRSFGAFESDASEDVRAALDVGWAQSQLVIGCGGEVRCVRRIGVGLGHLVDAVAGLLGVSAADADALRQRFAGRSEGDSSNDPLYRSVTGAVRRPLDELVREVALCLRYAAVTFRGERPARLCVVGGGARDAAVLGALGRALPVAVEAGLEVIGGGGDQMHADWAMALGLAMTGSRAHVQRTTACPAA